MTNETIVREETGLDLHLGNGFDDFMSAIPREPGKKPVAGEYDSALYDDHLDTSPFGEAYQ